MLEPLSRTDTPRGLSFSLGYRIDPGSSLIFLRSTVVRAAGATSGGFQQQWRDTAHYIHETLTAVDPQAEAVKIRRFLTTSRDERTLSGQNFRNPATKETWREIFGDALPASTSLQVAGSGLYGSLLDLEVWAAAPAGSAKAELVRVPAAQGVLPVAVAVRGDQQLCVASVQPDAGAGLAAEMISCLSKINARFAESGAGPTDVAKLTVYYRDPRSWPLIEAMVVGAFGANSPVLNGVVVSNLMHPETEIAMTGWARCGASGKNTPSVDLNNRLLALTGTGAIPIFVGGEANEMYKHGQPVAIEEQALIAMKNQQAVLESAGATFADVFRSNWYLTDLRDWPAIEPIVREYFPGGRIPVPMVVEVSRLTAKQGVRLEPDFWASLPANK